MTTAPAAAGRQRAEARGIAPLVAVTAANFVWQVPYAVRQYGLAWTRLSVWSAGLVFAGVWFAVAAYRYRRALHGGHSMILTFLVVEVLFYVLHDATGAFGADLGHRNPVVFIASVLGYVNLLAAAAYVWLLRSNPGSSARS